MSDKEKCDEKNRLVKGKGKRCKSYSNVILPYEAKMNPALMNGDLLETASEAFKQKTAIKLDAGVVMHADPFQCCQMSGLIADERFNEGLRCELLDQIFYEKNNDLYSFQQTNDLKKISTPHVKLLRRFFADDFCRWLSKVTGLSFTDRIDLTCSKYEYTDVLLCHDDELDSRRVAFAFYLVPPHWSDSDGGLLDLFNMDEHGQPKEVVKSLLPAWNSISWFEVTESSHHQVSEVLALDKTRLSVNGWFHALPIPRRPRYVEPPRPLLQHIEIEEQMVYDWVSPIYLDAATQTEIRVRFEEESEIELQDFLKEDKYQKLISEISSSELAWTSRGPPNKRHYDSLSPDSMPDAVSDCARLLQSEALFLILSNLTGLRLHRLIPLSATDDEEAETEEEDIPPVIDFEAEAGRVGVSAEGGVNREEAVEGSEGSGSESSRVKRQKLSNRDSAVDAEPIKKNDNKKEKEAAACDPRCRREVRRWRHGCYTLAHDTDAESCTYALDAVLYCTQTAAEWAPKSGGFTSYIAKGEDEELLTVRPAGNCLALVYRDIATLKFVKHLNHRTTADPANREFFDFAFTYYE